MDRQNIIPSEVAEAQVIFLNHSGGKDSQAMLAYLIRIGYKGRIVIIHADLGSMEWEEMKPWIETISHGLPVNVVKGDKDFFELCEDKGRLPSGQAQFCTNELKTVPCERFMKAYCAERGLTKAISAIGIRHAESKARSKKKEIIYRTKGTTKKFPLKLTVWNPIIEWSLTDVYKEISRAGQKIHRIYSEGFTRLSCAACVFGRIGEHKEAAKRKPELFKRMAQLERTLGKTIRLKQVNKVKMHKYLDEYIEIQA